MSSVTAELLLKHGFSYDHSQGYRGFVPFYARVGDRWSKIDYASPAAEWMHPLEHGREIDLVDIGANCGPWWTTRRQRPDAHATLPRQARHESRGVA